MRSLYDARTPQRARTCVHSRASARSRSRARGCACASARARGCACSRARGCACASSRSRSRSFVQAGSHLEGQIRGGSLESLTCANAFFCAGVFLIFGHGTPVYRPLRRFPSPRRRFPAVSPHRAAASQRFPLSALSFSVLIPPTPPFEAFTRGRCPNGVTSAPSVPRRASADPV